MEFICEPLFETEQPQQEVKQRSLDPVQCELCGEWSQNEYIHTISHNRVFNGWCSHRLFLTNRIRAWRKHAPDEIPAGTAKSLSDDLKWLTQHGFTVCDPHDPENWT